MLDNDELNKDTTANGTDQNPAQQETASTDETQYRYSRNDIPFNNNQNTGDNAEQNSTNTTNNMGQNTYNNGYNGSAQSYSGYSNNNSYQNGYNYNNASNQNGYGANQYNNNNNYNQQYQQNNPYYTNMKQNTSAKKHKNKAKKDGSGFMKNKVVRLVASALVFGIVAGGVMFGLNYAGMSLYGDKKNSSYEIQTVSPNLSTNYQVEGQETSSTGMNVEAVAQAAIPAMVELNGTTQVTGSYGFWGQQSQEAQTSGTGIIVGKNETELLILTNAHVIDGVNNLSCSFVDGEAVACDVKGSKTDKDIAVVAVDLDKIKESTLNSIAIAELGESDDVVLGQQVVAIGNALGEGQSVTSGIVSALDRSITVNNVTFSGLFLTDAAINSGNSGGALLDAAGKVVGINFAKTSESGVEGMAYSIPVSTVRDLIDSLMTREKRSMVSDDKASYLGITGVDITSSMAQSYSYPQGIMINQVVSGSAADKAGLGAYDIIVSFDDQTITSMSGLQSIMKYYSAGETVKIEYYHIEGNEYVLKNVDVTLGKKN